MVHNFFEQKIQKNGSKVVTVVEIGNLATNTCEYYNINSMNIIYYSINDRYSVISINNTRYSISILVYSGVDFFFKTKGLQL